MRKDKPYTEAGLLALATARRLQDQLVEDGIYSSLSFSVYAGGSAELAIHPDTMEDLVVLAQKFGSSIGIIKRTDSTHQLSYQAHNGELTIRLFGMREETVDPIPEPEPEPVQEDTDSD